MTKYVLLGYTSGELLIDWIMGDKAPIMKKPCSNCFSAEGEQTCSLGKAEPTICRCLCHYKRLPKKLEDLDPSYRALIRELAKR